jgi:hypothetical protein
MDIKDLFDVQVEDIDFLHIVNGRKPFTDLFDKRILLDYLKKLNEEYCEEHGLCEVCRSPLVEYSQKEDVRGSYVEVARYMECPNNCV